MLFSPSTSENAFNFSFFLLNFGVAPPILSNLWGITGGSLIFPGKPMERAPHSRLCPPRRKDFIPNLVTISVTQLGTSTEAATLKVLLKHTFSQTTKRRPAVMPPPRPCGSPSKVPPRPTQSPIPDPVLPSPLSPKAPQERISWGVRLQTSLAYLVVWPRALL